MIEIKKNYHNSPVFKELYFAIPDKLQKYIDLIPEHAGILLCTKSIYEEKIHYTAFLHRPPVRTKAVPLSLEDKYKLAKLGTMRIWNLKEKLLLK